MTDPTDGAQIPAFRLYGEGNPDVERRLRPTLVLRGWDELSQPDKATAYAYIRNIGWLKDYPANVLSTIAYLHATHLQACPGKNLQTVAPRPHQSASATELRRREAALVDFEVVFADASEDMVLRMLSIFARNLIEVGASQAASKEEDALRRADWVEKAFKTFDLFAKHLNHLFEQFAVNQVVTRTGFVPRQDDAITALIYVPTIAVLADPRWKPVSDDLAAAFDDYRAKNYSEAITKAHTAVQHFLQILVGEEGKNGKGEVGKLINEAKTKRLIPINRFTEPLVNLTHSFIVSERATSSTAKPALKEPTHSDALLVLNTVMVFLQFCLQAT